MVRMTNVLIGLVLVGLMATVMVNFMTSLNEEFSPVGFNSSKFDKYVTPTFQENETSANVTLKNITDKVLEDAANAEEASGVLNIIGTFFGSGYSAMLNTVKSIGIIKSLVTAAGDDLAVLGLPLKQFTAVIITIIGIIFSFLLLELILKRNL